MGDTRAARYRGRGKNSSRNGFSICLATIFFAVFVGISILLISNSGVAGAASLPSGFQDKVVIDGLTNPTAVQFSKDGRVFVAEKSGVIKVFDSLSDPTPTTFADLRTKVHNFWDRGLLGLALDPGFPQKPYVYALYTYDAALGGTAPRWGSAGATSDTCPTPPGATADGCVVSGHLSRLTASGDTMVSGSEKVLIEDWCQQYPSHSVGTLAFGPDGSLYAGGGDGASFLFSDYGQAGNPTNPCGDPPVGVGGAQKPPTAEGGSLRSQDLRTSGDPVGLDGTIVRVDPATGAALPDNPLSGNPDPNARRVVAYGLRNPFRFTIRPGTNEVWLGDVGSGKFEEIDRLANPTDNTADNFGWPCYEGAARNPGFDNTNLNVCEGLYNTPNAVTAPFYSYDHNESVVAGDSCGTGSSSVSGLAFYGGGAYPARYDGALFFADYSRKCIWTMFKGDNGLPDPATRTTLVTDAGGARGGPVSLQTGPGGDLFYVDLGGGAIHRVSYYSANQPPTAVAKATPTSGPTPLTVNFDGTGSRDPNGDALTYAWDLDGDGAYDDSTAPNPTYTYSTAGSYKIGLKVTDGSGASDTLDQPLTISPGNSAPQVSLEKPLSTLKWKFGQRIAFSGSATDAQDGTLPASALSWSLILNHCSSPGVCHEHPVQDFPNTAVGSFVAPDHEYPSYLVLRLTATDSGGLQSSKSVRINPQLVRLTFRSNPTGLRLVAGDNIQATPFARTAIVGSRNSISAPSPQALAGSSYGFLSWSDGQARSHDIVAPATAKTYTATYRKRAVPRPSITLISPFPNTRVKDRTPIVRATVRDARTDLTAANIRLYLDGRRKAFIYYRTVDRLKYTPQRNLAVGRHIVRVVARNASGGVTLRRWGFRIIQ